jgi:methylaspartate mutase epsilon subunit
LGRYEKAQEALEESNRTGQPKLNGYPTVAQGVKNTRKVVEATEGALDQRLTNSGGIMLMAEIAFASGMTAALVDPLMNFAAYEKKTTVEDCIKECQYIHRLVGYYTDRGVPLTVDIDGSSANVQFPMSVDMAGKLISALMAAEQGVKSIIPWSYQYGQMAQDIAWARVMRRLIREYLDKFGYKDVVIPGIFLGSIPMLPFPQDMGWAFGFLSYHAVVAALAEAQGVYVRTVDEGAGIPTKEAHAMSYRAANWIFEVVRTQKVPLDIEEIAIEERVSEMEVRAIMDKILELGDGDVAIGAVKGVETGILDWPLAININCKSQALGIRDSKGACRYLDFGNIPIPEEAREFHRQKVAEREKKEGRKMDYKVVIEDLMAFTKGKIIGG